MTLYGFLWLLFSMLTLVSVMLYIMARLEYKNRTKVNL